MGYVAELQQFDPVPPYVHDLAGPGPVTSAGLAPEPPATDPVPPGASTRTIVSHIGHRPARRFQGALLGGAAALILIGAGLLYTAVSGPEGSHQAARAPGAAVSGGPADGALPLDAAPPVAEPLTGRTTAPAPASPGAARATTDDPLTDRPEVPVLPALPDPVLPAPVATVRPTEPAGPAPDPPLVAPVAPLPLAATLSQVAEPAEDGFRRYAGTVRVSNPGDRDVTGWRVTLTVPGGNPVTASGATAAQDGETVTFTPDGNATVPAAGAVTFSFEVAGVLTALPGGCAIDASPCS